MANIRKLKNGSYQATIYVGRDKDGKMIRKYVTKDSFPECKAAARVIEQQVYEKTLTNLTNMKMPTYMDKWLEVNKAFLSPTTIKAYTTYINTHFKKYPAFEKSKVCQVTEMQVKEYLSKKLETLSPTTVRKHFFTLKKIMYDALKTKSPCADIKPPQTGDFKPTIPTSDEFEQIHQVFKSIGLQDEIIILLAGQCGLRRGEIFALKWDDIDEKEGSITIDEAVALKEEGYEFEFKQPKSHNGIRTIVAPDTLIELLKQWKSERPKINSKINRNNENTIKKNADKKDIQPEIFTYNPHTFTKKYAKIIKETKLMDDKILPQIRFHDLRHYHAVFLYENDIPDLYAAERLGHDIWVLKKIYQHLGIEKKNEYDEKIKNILDKK